MLLNDEIPEHQAAPKEYDLELADSNVKNTFVFSERDLPRFAAREKARRQAAQLDLPQSVLRARDARIEKKTGNTKGNRYQNNFFQHIPSKLPLEDWPCIFVVNSLFRTDEVGWQDPL